MASLARTIVLLLTLSSAGLSEAAQVELAWNPATDGVTTGYIIFYGTASGSYTQQVNVGLVTSYTVTGLKAGATYYFVVRAYNAAGELSAPSNEVSQTLPSPGPPPGRTNVALAANGAVAVASSSYDDAYGPAGAINGDRRGLSWGKGGGWHDGTPEFPDFFEVQFNGTKTVNEIDVFSVQDDYRNPDEPTAAMTFTLWGLQNFDVQYWTGTSWQTVTGGSITGNNLVWRQFTFAPITTTKIRVRVNLALNSWSRIAEIEAWAVPGGSTNVALAANGAVAVASSSYTDGYGPDGAINGDRRGQSWGNGGGWHDGTPEFPDFFEVQFNGTKTIDEIDVFSVQDDYRNPGEPTAAMTFTLWGLQNFDVQYWTGTSWQTVTGGSITGNNLVWRQITFDPITTAKIRVRVDLALNSWSRIAEIEAWTVPGGS
jgi:hypothetical protein